MRLCTFYSSRSFFDITETSLKPFEEFFLTSKREIQVYIRNSIARLISLLPDVNISYMEKCFMIWQLRYKYR